MKFYIGLGGIGCQVLADFAEKTKDSSLHYYIDGDERLREQKNGYWIPKLKNGATLRTIGRNAIDYELYTKSLDSFFSAVTEQDEVELVFVLSSFGGFGGAAVSQLVRYLEAIAWKKITGCSVIAFNENVFGKGGFPEVLMRQFELNTIDFVEEMRVYEQAGDSADYFQSRIFNPECRAFLIDTQKLRTDEFWKCLTCSEKQIEQLDCKAKYRLSRTKREELPDVFISYSSKDQVIADLIADELSGSGISSWIATRNIKEGSYAKQIMQGIKNSRVFLVLISKNSICSEQVKNEIDRAFNRLKEGIKIIPFILDDSELDDECKYYLCRQEMFSGKEPPVKERIRELVREIQKMVI
ncbi:MAG: toll/interleukin-1 receptor domain-containing protein [Eubacteriales bacterium]|nr:toll/interleukin-1 receptor domain-containing protein [Eubacteriales bacterium]